MNRRGFLKGLASTGLITIAPAIVDSNQLFRGSTKIWTPESSLEFVVEEGRYGGEVLYFSNFDPTPHRDYWAGDLHHNSVTDVISRFDGEKWATLCPGDFSTEPFKYYPIPEFETFPVLKTRNTA